jgi:hypothetical protein
MTASQLTYPLVALIELGLLTRQSRQTQNGPALRLWLKIQLAIFCILEPTSFLPPEVYGRYFLACTLVSSAADLMVLYSVFFCLEDGFPAFGSARAWSSTAILAGLLFCFAAGLALPHKAQGVAVAWLTVVQGFTYIRALCLIMLSLYGYLRASSWPRDLAWTWIGMAVYGITDAVVTRIQIFESNTNLLEVVTTIAAVLQLVGWWRALSYIPKPLTSLELEGATNLRISNL